MEIFNDYEGIKELKEYSDQLGSFNENLYNSNLLQEMNFKLGVPAQDLNKLLEESIRPQIDALKEVGKNYNSLLHDGFIGLPDLISIEYEKIESQAEILRNVLLGSRIGEDGSISSFSLEPSLGYQTESDSPEIDSIQESRKSICARLEFINSYLEKTFENTDLHITRTELVESWKAILRLPEPNLSGAVFHAKAALESIAREFVGNRNLTLGEIVKKRNDLFPSPLNEAVSKMWGFASTEARHGSEGRRLEYNEAIFLVEVSTSLCCYLLNKMRNLSLS